jgi:gliding motility-associated-like protein
LNLLNIQHFSWFKISFTFIIFFFLDNKSTNAQCPTSTFYTQGNNADFSLNATSLKLGTDIIIKADPSFSATINGTIKYRLGFFGSATLSAADFNCTGSAACVTNPSTSLADELDAKIVQSPNVVLGFNKPGIYTIIQIYTNGNVNYYNCKTVMIYEEPQFTIKTCNCTLAFVNIPKSTINDFYDEMEVSFVGTSNKVTIKKANYGGFVQNTSPYPGYTGSGPCPAIISSKAIKVEGIKKMTGFPDFKYAPAPTPIDFSDNFNVNGIVHHAEELRNEANGDFIFKSERFVDILEVSYDGVAGTWTNLPTLNYSISNSGKTFTIRGITPTANKELCFRGNANSPCGNTIPANMRPVACMTGEIKTISDEFNFTTARRDVIINIESIKNGANANVMVNLGKPSEASLSSSSLVFKNEMADCLPNEYRVKTSYNSATFASKKTLIYSKPQNYTLLAGTGKALPGILSVSIKQTGYLPTDISALIKHEKTFPANARINYYGADANSTTFTKLNALPINQNNYLDKALNLATTSRCYQIKYLDQCNFESLPTDPICTTHLKANSGILEWNKADVATNQPTSQYLPVSNYTVEEVECVGGNCVSIKSFPPSINTTFTADIADTAPLTKDFAYLRVLVNTNPAVKSLSNIYKYFFPAKIYIPTSFTPNGDAINDILKINGFHVGNFKMTIYNRWGAIVQTLNSFTETWDGIDFEEGAYMYSVEATDLSTSSGSKIYQKGIIWLMR